MQLSSMQLSGNDRLNSGRTRQVFSLVLAGCCAFALSACSSDDESTGESNPDGSSDSVDGDQTGDEFVGTGVAAPATVDYAPGPFGYSVGSVIPNFALRGYGAPAAGANIAELQVIELGEFYNPTRDRVFPDGSKFGAGNPVPFCGVISVASSWCPPCQYEAAEIIPGEVAHYKPLGGLIMMQLQDGPTVGKPATLVNLSQWINAYDVDYPATLDPSGKLGALFAADAFPANMIINFRDMRIVQVVAGVPNAGFWTKFDQCVAGEI